MDISKEPAQMTKKASKASKASKSKVPKILVCARCGDSDCPENPVKHTGKKWFQKLCQRCKDDHDTEQEDIQDWLDGNK